ncbi:MAG: ERCC4 domain-containing protein [Lachnospiraceae bacterium]|nr:ERCC4 domain-containing protein [Lachnospiraceae bacterium]
MTGYQIKKALESFRIIVDTREQATNKLEARLKDFGCPYERATLDYGDYTFNVTLADGVLCDTSVKVAPKVAIERKMDIDELALCLTHERVRFLKELERAKDKNAKMYLLIENGSWDDIINGNYKSWINSRTFLSNICFLQAHYDLNIVFCKDYNAGIVIKTILYQEAREYIKLKGSNNEKSNSIDTRVSKIKTLDR